MELCVLAIHDRKIKKIYSGARITLKKSSEMWGKPALFLCRLVFRYVLSVFTCFSACLHFEESVFIGVW